MLSDVVDVHPFDLASDPHAAPVPAPAEATVHTAGLAHGVALWVDYLGESAADTLLSNGPRCDGPDVEGCVLRWFDSPKVVGIGDALRAEVHADLASGEWDVTVRRQGRRKSDGV